ncbi:MAG: hypothetical protein IH991_10015, partial [Planctomycetes bacterium]|nr:hypothetical protein [Planctomycetota bacterium]
MRKKLTGSPSVELQRREGDEHLEPAELAQLDLFEMLNSPPRFEKHSAAAVLRHYKQGDVICRQGETGRSAFYALLSEDVLTLKHRQLDAARRKFERAGEETIEISEQLQDIKSVINAFKIRLVNSSAATNRTQPTRQVATAHLSMGHTQQARPTGVLGRLNRKLFGAGSARVDEPPEFIPNDGPTDINYQTKQAPIFEGEIFGEMSCVTHAPRSATIVAETECFMLEFTRLIYDELQRDPKFRERVDRNYRDRLLKGHLRRLDVLNDLTDAQFDFIRERVRLEIVDPGEVICDENDPSDEAYIVR